MVYNLTYGSQTYPTRSHHLWELQGEYVFGSFWLYSLLKDLADNDGGELHLPHHPSQRRTRYHDALEQRNQRMTGPGQDLWNHACDICHLCIPDGNGGMSKCATASCIIRPLTEKTQRK